MAFEKRWAAIPALSFTADGGTTSAGTAGLVTISSTFGYHEKQQIIIIAMSKVSLELEVKAVISATQMYVGSPGAITGRTDLTGYTVLANAQIFANEQPRPAIPDKEFIRAMFEEAPISAQRSYLVDYLGNGFNEHNPLPVAFDGTVSIGDVSIVEGGNTMAVNPDGTINVNVVSSPTSSPGLNIAFGQVTNVAGGASTTIHSYTASGPNGFRMFKIEASGENIAVFTVSVNASVIALKRTYWGNFNTSFEFENYSNGLLLNPGDTVVISVLHQQPSTGDFEATFYGLAL